AALPLELSRIRTNLALRRTIFEYHVWLLKRTLQMMPQQQHGVACQVFRFAEAFPAAPAGARYAIKLEPFEFTPGREDGVPKDPPRGVFSYVVDNAERYGIGGLRPTRPGGSSYLVLSSASGTFAPPFEVGLQGAGVEFLVVVRESLRAAAPRDASGR